MIRFSSACARIVLKRRIPYSTVPRRAKSTSGPANATTSTSNPKTIPVPSLLWLEPIVTPFRAYGRAQQRRPYVTQLLSSLVIYFLGDLSAQRISGGAKTSDANTEQTSEEGAENTGGWTYDPARTARALLIGGLSSIPSYRWFLWLGESFNYSSKILSITTKVAVNQVVFTPIFNCYFFGMQCALAGASASEIVERIKNTVPVSWVNSCKIWPAVTAFSFTFVPLPFRSIFAGVIAIGWQTYLSFLNQQAAKEEEMEHEREEAVRTPVAQTTEKQPAAA